MDTAEADVKSQGGPFVSHSTVSHTLMCCVGAADAQQLLAGSDVDSMPLPPIEEEHNELDSDIDLDAMD